MDVPYWPTNAAPPVRGTHRIQKRNSVVPAAPFLVALTPGPNLKPVMWTPEEALDGVDIQRVRMNALMIESMDMNALGVCS